jgi:hypothetical protein
MIRTFHLTLHSQTNIFDAVICVNLIPRTNYTAQTGNYRGRHCFDRLSLNNSVCIEMWAERPYINRLSAQIMIIFVKIFRLVVSSINGNFQTNITKFRMQFHELSL